MATYTVVTNEICERRYEVEADSPADALSLLRSSDNPESLQTHYVEYISNDAIKVITPDGEELDLDEYDLENED